LKRDVQLAPQFITIRNLVIDIFYLAAIVTNVRRYVALAQSRGGARFCTRGAMQDYDVIWLFSRWQKP